jgi:hypothetical protein
MSSARDCCPPVSCERLGVRRHWGGTRHCPTALSEAFDRTRDYVDHVGGLGEGGLDAADVHSCRDKQCPTVGVLDECAEVSFGVAVGPAAVAE